MTRFAIIVASTRPGRNGTAVAHWFHTVAQRRSDATFDVLELADFNLPHLDEPIPAAMNQPYAHARTRAWSEAVASYDGYFVVTPEYNHSIPGALKDAIDFLYAEWHNKAIGFVSYGLAGGVRAVEHLRGIAAELHLADVRASVALSIFTDFVAMTDFAPAAHHERLAGEVVDQVLAWSGALAPLRTGQAAPGDRRSDRPARSSVS